MIIQIDDFLSYMETYLRESINTQDYQIEVGEWMNTSPEIAAKGWVCIYHQGIEYVPRTLGNHAQAWQGSLYISVIVQNADYKSGKECTLELQRRVKNVVSVFSQGSIASNFVDTITQLDINFSFVNADSETVYFQNAVLDFTLAFSGQL
jgi:hypothetical protein